MRYSHLAPDHKQKAVDRLADLLKYYLGSTEKVDGFYNSPKSVW